jgi:hypothetical protein
VVDARSTLYFLTVQRLRAVVTSRIQVIAFSHETDNREFSPPGHHLPVAGATARPGNRYRSAGGDTGGG